MSEERQLGLWHMSWESEAVTPEIRDQKNGMIATIAEASKKKMLVRAGVIAAAPALYGATEAALQVFRVMAEREAGTAALAANDMIPALESALEAANLLGPVTQKALVGR